MLRALLRTPSPSSSSLSVSSKSCLAPVNVARRVASRPTQPQTPCRPFSNTPSARERSVQWSHLSGIKLSQTQDSGGITSPEEIWSKRSRDALMRLPPMKDTYAGRSVQVTDGDVQLSLNRLKYIISSNNVRFEMRAQQRHEKKGYKRRRLASLRWRRRFAFEVGKKIKLVNAIRARGA